MRCWATETADAYYNEYTVDDFVSDMFEEVYEEFTTDERISTEIKEETAYELGFDSIEEMPEVIRQGAFQDLFESNLEEFVTDKIKERYENGYYAP